MPTAEKQFSPLAMQYLRPQEWGENRQEQIVRAAAHLAIDLMRSDSRTQRVGYTRENALIAAVEQFGVDTWRINDDINVYINWWDQEFTISDRQLQYFQNFKDPFQPVWAKALGYGVVHFGLDSTEFGGGQADVILSRKGVNIASLEPIEKGSKFIAHLVTNPDENRATTANKETKEFKHRWGLLPDERGSGVPFIRRHAIEVARGKGWE